MSEAEFERILPALAKRARLEANRLISLNWFRPDERKDLEQELLLQVWRKRALIGADDESSAYCTVVMRNRGRDLARNEYAPGCDRRRRRPLPDDLDVEDRQLAPPALISQPEYDSKIDLQRAIELLPTNKRQFTWLLADQGIAAAAQEAGVSRATGWRWASDAKTLLRRQGLGPTGRPAAGGRKA